MSFVRNLWFLPTFGDAMRMATETRRAEEVFPSNGVGCPSSLHTQKRQIICKLPRFTKSGQEPILSVKPHTPRLFFQKNFKPVGACAGDSIAHLFFPRHFIP